jgi:hypothetical protein
MRYGGGGGMLPVFRGRYIRRGMHGGGIGGIFARVFKAAVPLITRLVIPAVKTTVKRAGKSLLRSGVRAAKDIVLNQTRPTEALRKQGRQLKRKAKRKVVNVLVDALNTVSATKTKKKKKQKTTTTNAVRGGNRKQQQQLQLSIPERRRRLTNSSFSPPSTTTTTSLVVKKKKANRTKPLLLSSSSAAAAALQRPRQHRRRERRERSDIFS